jgi:plasmid maintenance system antidote protein VapI
MNGTRSITADTALRLAEHVSAARIEREVLPRTAA